MSVVQKMWEKIGLISFTVFEEKRVMDFIIPASSEHFSKMGLHYGEGCKYDWFLMNF